MDNDNKNDFNKERTEVFDKIKKKNSQFYNSKIQPVDEARPSSRAERPRLPSGGDGSQFYHLKGSEIKSSRQRMTDVQPPQRKPQSPPRPVSSPRRNDGVNISGRRKTETKRRHSYIGGIIKVVLYIAFILFVAGAISYNAIMIANDVFALVKEPSVKTVTIPEGAEIEKVAEILAEHGLIKYPKMFKFYAQLRKNDTGFLAGTYMVENTMNYDEFIFEFTYDKSRNTTITITIPEGFTVDEIIDLFISKGIGTRSKFIDVINNTKFNYKFIELLDSQILSKDRKYRLEGYLFPDTYDFYSSSSETYVIDTLLRNFNIKFDETFYTRCENLNYSVDEIITLASIVEREAANSDEFRSISAVFHNRLLNPNFPYLESDATIQYSFEKHKSELTGADMELDLPYNTYNHAGLTPSAICNPGYEAILAALFPEEGSTYLYFVHDAEGNTYFAETYDKHLANINIARSGK